MLTLDLVIDEPIDIGSIEEISKEIAQTSNGILVIPIIIILLVIAIAVVIICKKIISKELKSASKI